MKKNKTRIPKSLLPIFHNIKRLRDLERRTQNALDVVMSSLSKEIEELLSGTGMAKSSLPANWEAKVPKISLSVTQAIEKIVERHMQALKASLLGRAAGGEAWETARELNLHREIPAGGITEAYLGTLDAQAEQLRMTGDKVDLNPETSYVKESLKFIETSAGNFVDASISSLKGKIVSGVGQMIMSHNDQTEHTMREHMTSELEADPTVRKRALVKDALGFIKKKTLSISEVKQFLKGQTKDYAVDWNRIVATELATANGVASVQIIKNVSSDEDPDVCIVNVEDERVSPECKHWSRHEDGTLKIVKLSDLKPPGYNNGKKKAQWLNCVNPRHPNCRCHIMYLPNGFTVDINGSLVKKPGSEDNR